MELVKAKTQALKTGSWDGIMIISRTVIRELKWWIRRIGYNQLESLINKTITCMLTTDSSPQGWGATLIYDNQIELIQHDCWSEKEAEMISNAKEIKTIYYRLFRFEQVFKKMQDQAVLIYSDNTTVVYDIEKWKAKESLIERIKQVFYLVKRLQLQITTIHIQGKLNSTTDSLSRLCRSGDYILKDGMIKMICKPWNYMPHIDIFATQYNKLINNYVIVDINDLETHFYNAQNSGDGKQNERRGSRTSSRQCGRLPSGPVADVGRDLLMRCMKIRGFSEEGVNLLFQGQRFNSVKRKFYSLALLQDWIDIERITIDELMKKDTEVILTEVIAFHTRQNNSVTSAKSHKACLTIIPNEIAELRLKFSNINKTENQASLRLAPKQANAIETYELLRELKIVGAQAYSIRNTATTELAKLEQMIQLDKERGGQPIIILDFIGDMVMICYPVSPYLTSGPPKMRIPTRGEIEIRREFPRDLKDRTSGMMLMVGWSGWNDNAEIRTLLCRSLISLITDYRQRDVVYELHRRI
ncbi:MAG: hypothetical protein EZS28_009456 [Streblomastix strix]|uniref:Uncharacterized protein n=1 Tax=Streblomastix strix TaxID=222440 RepID=A0A5J4WJS5_9EUKA|nr:MAG: hypothetical protein EZS28_009456 [Streblomastix strix]